MAGNPLQILIPHIKKNAVLLYILAGPLLYLAGRRKDAKIYKTVYGENDFHRSYHLERLRDHIDQEERNRSTAAEVTKH